MVFAKRSLVSLACALFLAACGGGGDSGSNSSTSSTVNSSNAVGVSVQAFNASEGLNSEAETGSDMAAGVEVTTAKNGAVKIALDQLYIGLKAVSSNNVATGAELSDTVACTDGGTETISFTVADPNAASIANGDMMKITANNCVESGQTVNGTVAFAFNNIVGTIDTATAWKASLAISFVDFSVKQDPDTTTLNGGMTLTVDQLDVTLPKVTGVGSSLSTKFVHNGALVYDRTLAAFDFAVTRDLTTSAYTFSDNFILSGRFANLTNVAYAVKTTKPFKGMAGSNPTEGAFTVTATDNTSVTLTVIDTNNVKLDLDKNGDGTIDETINTTWVDLRSKA